MTKKNYLIMRAGANFRLGSGITVEHEAGMMDALLRFLQDNALLVREIKAPAGSWEDFELRIADFTSLGQEVIQTGFDRWLRGIDRGKPVNDVSILEKYLKIAKSTRDKPDKEGTNTAGGTEADNKSEVLNAETCIKYDDASWHPNDGGAIHIGMFAAWCALNGLLPHVDPAHLTQLKNRDMTPGDWLLTILDGKLLQLDLNDTGNGFTGYYYSLDSPLYLRDYTETFCSGGTDWLALEDSWQNFDLLRPQINRRFAAWCDAGTG